MDSESKNESIVPEESESGCVCLMKKREEGSNGKVAKANGQKYLLKLLLC